jgi:hypothetical protein
MKHMRRVAIAERDDGSAPYVTTARLTAGAVRAEPLSKSSDAAADHTAYSVVGRTFIEA